jgi:transposase
MPALPHSLGRGPGPSDEPAAKTYAAALKARGKHGGIIACALAHRATRIAHALVRDQSRYNPSRWT